MLSTGDEVLHGQIVDTNAVWLAEFLFRHGLPMTCRLTIGDNSAALVAVLTERSQIADVLIVNGGLGPTSDDMTAQAVATALGVELEVNLSWLKKISAFFASRGESMATINRKQAELPPEAEVMDNPLGTACGFIVQFNRCWMFFTPGVPAEFKLMVEQQILPRLKQRGMVAESPLCLRLTTFGCGESDLAALLEPLTLPCGVVIGYRAAMPIVELKLSGAPSQQAVINLLWHQIRRIVAEWTVFEGTEGMPALLARLLDQRQLTLSVSEQYTAGLLQWQLSGADIDLMAGSVLPAKAESMRAMAARGRALARDTDSALSLVVGSCQQHQLILALHTPDGTFAHRISFYMQGYSLSVRQEVIAMVAMDLLRRWLLGKTVTVACRGIEVLESVKTQ